MLEWTTCGQSRSSPDVTDAWRDVSATFGAFDSLCHNRPLQGSRHHNMRYRRPATSALESPFSDTFRSLFPPTQVPKHRSRATPRRGGVRWAAWPWAALRRSPDRRPPARRWPPVRRPPVGAVIIRSDALRPRLVTMKEVQSLERECPLLATRARLLYDGWCGKDVWSNFLSACPLPFRRPRGLSPSSQRICGSSWRRWGGAVSIQLGWWQRRVGGRSTKEKRIQAERQKEQELRMKLERERQKQVEREQDHACVGATLVMSWGPPLGKFP